MNALPELATGWTNRWRRAVLLSTEDADEMFAPGSGSMTETSMTQEQECLFLAAFMLFLRSRKVASRQPQRPHAVAARRALHPPAAPC